MTDYTRGWKDSSSRSPYFQKIEKRRPGNPKARGKLLAIGRKIFGFLGQSLKWLLFSKGFWKKLLLLGLASALIVFIFFGLLFVYYSFNLPDPNRLLSNREVAESTKILDRNGKLLYEIHGEEKRTLVALEQVPKFAKDATIAVEDKDFYKHRGISFTGIARALLIDIVTGTRRQGGSTITQQFVRNAVLSREKTFTRKFKEIVLSLQLERKYNKDEILQLYLNEIPYGSNAYGIEAASQTFFGKTVKDLSLTEAAYIAALPKAPTYFSPYGPNKHELDSRADTVLQLMYEQGHITKEQRNRAQNEKVEFRRIGTGILAPHFVLYVQDLLAQKYGEIGLQEGGLKVTTTLDLDLQQLAESIIAKQVPLNEKNYNATNAALVAIDPKTGQILAMVGSRDYFDEQHDGAVNVVLRPRQPGSSFKPYVYATAFKKGMSPATMLLDVVTNFGEYGGKEYVPTDYDDKERGPVSIRQALQNSLNIPAVKTIIITGIDDAIDTAETMGITTLKDRSRYGPSLVLGGGEVKLLEHTAAYGAFANLGIKQETTAILKIEDKKGSVLEEYRSSPGREVLNPQIAYQINNVLSDKQARSLLFSNINNKLTLPDRPVAAKTGTTQEFHDAWTVGYTPSLVTGVWVGNSDNAEMKKGADGLVVAAPIWNEFMRRALEGKPVEDFARPDGIVEMAVDSLSGKLPTAGTPSTKIEIFSSFNLPTEQDDIHVQGLTILHSEKPDDPAWENPVRDWALANGYAWQPGTQNSGEPDRSITLKLIAPDKVTSLPWPISAQAQGKDEISETQLFLDNNFLAGSAGGSLEYTGNAPHVDGQHQLLVQIRTVNNKTSRQSLGIEFALNKKLFLLAPRDNQELKPPANIILESNLNTEPDNVKFIARATSRKDIILTGKVTKQQIGQIVFYTLNWSEPEKLTKGSYALFGQIGTDTSNQVAVKIP